MIEKLVLVGVTDEEIDGTPFKVLHFLDQKKLSDRETKGRVNAWFTPEKFELLNLNSDLIADLSEFQVNVDFDAGVGRKSKVIGVSA